MELSQLMTRFRFVIVLSVNLSVCPGIASLSALRAQTIATPETAADGSVHKSPISNIATEKPLITISGKCSTSSESGVESSKCKTVISQAEFEKIVAAIQPGMPMRARREFALRYADALIMAQKAEQMGLDKGKNYEEQMKLARIQVLSQDLKRAIQEKVSQISDQDVESFYRSNVARFERAKLERIYIPKSQRPVASEDSLNDVDKQERLRQSEGTMRGEADQLHARALAGEEFAKLQAAAYQVAKINSPVPDTNIEIKRASLPPNQAVAMDLKPAEVSSVLVEPNGYLIYKMEKKEVLPLDQAREEIKAILQSQRLQNEMQGIHDSANLTVDNSYFSR